MTNREYEVAIVGGSSGGLSAALTLGRSARDTIVFDTSLPRNRFAPHAHNFFTRDGTSPLELVQIGRSQLKQYTSVSFNTSKVVRIASLGNLFTLSAENGDEFSARRIIIATGVRDVLPEISGFKALWGNKIIHCPYCHGWEVRNKPLAIIMNGVVAHHMAMMISHWNKEFKIFTNGKSEIPEADARYWQSKNIDIIETPITHLADTSSGVEILLENGSVVSVSAIYSKAPKIHFNNELAVQLGCNVTDEGAIVVDDMKQTTVKGVYAVGDVAHPMMHQVAVAVAGGMLAGAGCNTGLIMEDFEKDRSIFESISETS